MPRAVTTKAPKKAVKSNVSMAAKAVAKIPAAKAAGKAIAKAAATAKATVKPALKPAAKGKVATVAKVEAKSKPVVKSTAVVSQAPKAALAKEKAKAEAKVQAESPALEAKTKKVKSPKIDLAGLDKSNALVQKWSSLFRKAQEQEPKPYNMKQAYEAKTPIMHKVLGWGYILANRNDRLEVLFKDGIRYLISNYKA